MDCLALARFTHPRTDRHIPWTPGPAPAMCKGLCPVQEVQSSPEQLWTPPLVRKLHQVSRLQLPAGGVSRNPLFDTLWTGSLDTQCFHEKNRNWSPFIAGVRDKLMFGARRYPLRRPGVRACGVVII